MRWRVAFGFMAGLAVAFSSVVQPLGSQTLTTTVTSAASSVLQLNLELMKQLEEPLVDESLNPPGKFSAVKPQEFDPGKTSLVQATWLEALGCPTGATIALPNETFTGVGGFAPYTDPACAVGDPDDARHEGLLLAKTGPTGNFAAAAAELINVKGITLTELGYDIRKQGTASASALGSHCGAGAPRFNVITSDGFFGIGCNSPPADVQQQGNGWLRLRWGGAGPLLGFQNFATLVPVTGTVQRIVIIFDEGQDAGPDFLGAAVLDNISVNGKMVGRGATDASSAPR